MKILAMDVAMLFSHSPLSAFEKQNSYKLLTEFRKYSASGLERARGREVSVLYFLL